MLKNTFSTHTQLMSSLSVLRYLIPCMHLSRKEHGSLKQKDCCSSSANSFLRLMPSWCPGSHNTANTHFHTEHIHWPRGAGQSDQPPFKMISERQLMWFPVWVRSGGFRQCWLLPGFRLPDGCKLPSLPLGRTTGHLHLLQVSVKAICKPTLSMSKHKHVAKSRR